MKKPRGAMPQLSPVQKVTKAMKHIQKIRPDIAASYADAIEELAATLSPSSAQTPGSRGRKRSTTLK